VTTTVAFGSTWLAPRLKDFLDHYPEITLSVVLDDAELDLAMREADVAIRMHPPRQPDLVQRHLLTISWGVFASKEYLAKAGTPERAEEVPDHKLVLYGDYRPPVPDINWLGEVGRKPGALRKPALEMNSIFGMLLAVRSGLGIAALPDYMGDETAGLVRILPELKAPKVDAYFVYPEELRNSKRVAVFRDFLLARLADKG
jgi:DNA-binding transcriptional LysR family regulator